MATVCRQIVKWLFVTAFVYSPSKCKVFYQKRLLAKFLRRKHVLFKKQATSFFWQNLRTWQCFGFCFFKFLKSLGDSMFPQVWGDSTTSIWVLVKASITNPTHSFFEFPDKISLQTKKTGLFSFFFGQPYPNLIQRLTIWGFGPELKEILSGGSFASSWCSLFSCGTHEIFEHIFPISNFDPSL